MPPMEEECNEKFTNFDYTRELWHPYFDFHTNSEATCHIGEAVEIFKTLV